VSLTPSSRGASRRVPGSVARGLALLAALAAGGCFSFMTKDEGRELQNQLDETRTITSKNEQRAAELAKQMDEQLRRLKAVVDEATRVVTRNSADVGGKVDKLQQDLAVLQGRLDDLQHGQEALTKQFQDYRAASDTKIEQLSGTLTTPKTPPVPETPDALFADAARRLEAQQWADSRRLFDTFVTRYAQDERAPLAQYNIGEAYAAEKRYANAIGAYTKVVDNFPKSSIVEDAMYKNGLAFYALKYCSDARVYFQELMKRYPKTRWKKDATDQLKLLQRDAKNKAVCAS
jgi:tol-pal system protein YbgF